MLLLGKLYGALIYNFFYILYVYFGLIYEKESHIIIWKHFLRIFLRVWNCIVLPVYLL
jgi:hypothetical protein